VGGGNTTSQQQTQNSTSTSNPYAAAQPMLNNLISSVQGDSTAPTAAQNTAAGNLVTAANGIPNLSGAVTGVTQGALGGDPTGMLNSGYNTLNSNIGGIASGSTDPMSNPAMKGWLDTISSDASNATNGAFAAAGRDFSPANSQATARGIAQGEAPVLANQYNTNVSNKLAASNSLYGAGNSTAGAITGNQQTGLSDAGALPGLLTAPATAQLNAANTQQQLPLSVQQQLEQLGIPLGALGGTTTSSGSGTGSTTQQTDPTSQIIGGLLGAASMAAKFSDERLKEDISPVGMLNDGQPVYSYRYAGSPTTEIGLMAQDVEKTNPDAVGERSGFKTVDYRAATAKARHIGGLLDLKRAA
jgi:hypothetical protein